MLGRPTTLLRVVLVASTLVGAEASALMTVERDAAPAQGGRATGPSGPDTKPRDPRKREPDQELLDHLDEIEHLELLQNLELFDTAAKRKK